MEWVETRYEHICLDQQNVPIIIGTKTKIIELVLDRKAYGWSPEELHFQYPHLSLGQIYSALAYYWDHRDALDRDIERRLARVEQMKPQFGATGLKHRLHTNGLNRVV